MFKKLRYRIRLNAALRELDIHPATLNPVFRDEVVAMGLRENLAPKEAAMEVLSVVYPGLNLVDRLGTLAVIRRWRRSACVRESRFQRALSGNLSDLQSTAFRDK